MTAEGDTFESDLESRGQIHSLHSDAMNSCFLERSRSPASDYVRLLYFNFHTVRLTVCRECNVRSRLCERGTSVRETRR